MRCSSTTPRLVALVALATLLSALVFAPAAVVARDAEREVRMSGSPGREVGEGRRPYRTVDVGSLPAASGQASGYESKPLTRPSTATPRASDISAAPAPVEVTTTVSPAANEPVSWSGLSRNIRPATMGEPPDPWVAVGPEHVFQAVNTTFQIRSRTGTNTQTIDMFDFFGLDGVYNDPSDVSVFDPRVIYDSLHGRWIAIEASFDCFPFDPFSSIGTGYIDIAISDTADPTGTWGVLSISYPDAVPDYPGLGTSTDKVVVSSNVFALGSTGPDACAPELPPTGFLGTEMDVMGWVQLLGAGTIDVDFLFSGPNPPIDSHFPNNYFSWRPALQAPATSATVFVIAEQTDEGVAYARITGLPSAGTTAINVTDLSAIDVIAPFALPPAPDQPGSPATIVLAVDARPTDAVWQANRLAWVSTYPCDPVGGATGDRDCVRVSEVSTAVPASPAAVQDFLIAEDDVDHYMGGIGYAGNGDLHVAWTRSSATAGDYPSSMAAYQLATDGPNELTAPDQLAAGTGTYPGTRWGDYVGVAQDPQVPNAVWQGNQFSSGGNWWGTRVSQLQTGGASYVPITPVRVLDTRPAFQTGLPTPFQHNVPKSWLVRGVGGIPAAAIAVTGNLTVTGQQAAGYVSVTPTANANPTSSTINFPLGDTRANNVTIPLNTDGRLAAVYKASGTRTTHLIFDVTGYFVAGSAAAEYATISPVRVLDTRPGQDIGGLATFQKNVPQTLAVAAANGIPAGATAITGNLTVVGQTGAGYLSVTPDPDDDPPTSNLNFPLGDTRANGVAVPLNGTGDLSIVYKTTGSGARSANVILDVTGYFMDDPAGLLYFPLNPGRLMDTRPIAVLSGLAGVFTSSSPRALDAGGHWGVPAGAAAITGNLTVVGQNAPGFVSITLTSQATPTTSVLNFPNGDIRANGVTVPTAGGETLWIVYKTTASGRTTHLILDVTGYFD